MHSAGVCVRDKGRVEEGDEVEEDEAGKKTHKHGKWKCCLCGLERKEQTNRLSEKPLILFVAASPLPHHHLHPTENRKKITKESHTKEGKTLK